LVPVLVVDQVDLAELEVADIGLEELEVALVQQEVVLVELSVGMVSPKRNLEVDVPQENKVQSS